MVEEQKSSYRQIFKAMGIFGGVQVFNILIGLVRFKVVAVFLGAQGFGINALLNTPITLISNITGLGIGFSAVRNISEANSSNNEEQVGRALLILRRAAWFTGILGMIITIILAPFLSYWSFKGYEYTLSFILLSLICLLTAISGGQTALLRGTRRIKDTAKAGLWGSIIGLFFTLPLFYFWGIKGIVPALIIASFFNMFFSWKYSRKVSSKKVSMSYKETFQGSKAMIKLGFLITLSGMVAQLVGYLITLFISNMGGLSQVGLYNAGWSMTNQYVGMIFAAMGADYFPKLSGLQNDNLKIREAVNQQAEVAILIIAPLMILFSALLPIIIKTLFTESFMPVISFALWAVLGMLFKATSWALGFIILAKGDSKIFLMSELLANAIILLTNVIGYYYYGIEGIGMSFLLSYILYLLIVYLLCRKRYDFFFFKNLKTELFFQLLFSVITFFIAYVLKYPVAYFSGAIMFCISITYSFVILNKKTDMLALIRKGRK